MKWEEWEEMGGLLRVLQVQLDLCCLRGRGDIGTSVWFIHDDTTEAKSRKVSPTLVEELELGNDVHDRQQG